MAAIRGDDTSKVEECRVQNLGTWSLKRASSLSPIEEVKDAA
eukprot:CAMPEP_0185274878 /NCGR_PEP_ID=MMETSP1359-20130426/52818_1 /TAXON_ID=552665 /ORGANISM="Bigelowiella longifila, Strain CCMP242" /LENGTH=41 /DNA_ID= /DNA_START= /DNA_END= /DNA_ORIENTATION=